MAENARKASRSRTAAPQSNTTAEVPGDAGRAREIASIRSQFPILQTPGLHYLDNAATSHMPQAVLDALGEFETGYRANVHGGVHRLARKALAAYESARDAVATYVGASSSRELVFTYGATSAINLVAHSLGSMFNPGDEVVISELEHHSNIVPWQLLVERAGITVKAIRMTPEGRLDLGDLERVVTKRCQLIAVTHCSNVTGAVTDTAAIVEAARAVGAKVLFDGAQRVPHGPVDVQDVGADFYAFSGHKMFGPTGIGGLWGRKECLEQMPPFMGGGQMIEKVTLESSTYTAPPRRFEAGTPPIAGAIGLGAAATWLRSLDWDLLSEHRRALTQRLLHGLQAIPGVRIVGPTNLDRRRGVVSFTADGHDLRSICSALDNRGVAVRLGHHCAQPLLATFGLDAVARASLALYNTQADIDALLNCVEDNM